MPRYSREEAAEAIPASLTFTEALKLLGMCWSGGNIATLRKWATAWGIPTDHFDPDAARLRNLRSATPLDDVLVRNSTYSRGRRLRKEPEVRRCKRCGAAFTPKSHRQAYCSRECGQRWDRRGLPRPGARRANRPPHEQLLAEVAATSWGAVGRKYGVSDNAVRKWVRAYERERQSVAADRAA